IADPTPLTPQPPPPTPQPHPRHPIPRLPAPVTIPYLSNLPQQSKIPASVSLPKVSPIKKSGSLSRHFFGHFSSRHISLLTLPLSRLQRKRGCGKQSHRGSASSA